MRSGDLGLLVGYEVVIIELGVPMSTQKFIASILVFSFFLSGCDLVAETQWITEAGW